MEILKQTNKRFSWCHKNGDPSKLILVSVDMSSLNTKVKSTECKKKKTHHIQNVNTTLLSLFVIFS